MRHLLYNATTASGSAIACASCINNYKSHPKDLTKNIIYSLGAGSVYGVSGLLMAIQAPTSIISLYLIQSLWGSVYSFSFLSFRSVVLSKELKYPDRDEPLGAMVCSSLAGGLTGVTLAALRGRAVVRTLPWGLLLGVCGHHMYEGVRRMRLEYVLRQQYPELSREMDEVEAYMVEMQQSNLEYTGPTMARSKVEEWSDHYMNKVRTVKDNMKENEL